MLELLLTFKQGSGYDAALEKVYGFDMDGLNTLWRSQLTQPAPPPAQTRLPADPLDALSRLGAGLLLALSLASGNPVWRRGW